MATSKARLRANNKYNAKTYKQVSVRVSPELADAFRIECEKNGESARSVLIRLMDEYITGERTVKH